MAVTAYIPTPNGTIKRTIETLEDLKSVYTALEIDWAQVYSELDEATGRWTASSISVYRVKW